VRVALAFAIAVAAAAGFFYLLLVVVPRSSVETGREAGRGAVEVAREGGQAALDLAQDLARRLAAGLGVTPRVSVDSRVLVEQTREALELATAVRSLQVEHTVAHTWLGSTKEIRLRGSYRGKAGFDLRQGFGIDVDSHGEGVVARLQVQLPAPQLLSMELLDVRVEEEEGLWNRIRPEDREAALRELTRVARREAESTGILEEARHSLERQVQEIVLGRVAPTEFRYGAPPSPSPAAPLP
jgi:hypothetical protein